MFIHHTSYILHHTSFQALNEVISLCLCQAQRWQQTQYVGSCTSCEAMLLLYQSCPYLFVWNVQFYSYHEALATNVHDVWLCLLQFLEFLYQVVAHDASILHQILLFQHVEYGKC